MGTWSLYMDMAIIQGHGHYTGTWPLYVDMDMLRKYKGYNHALYCLVIVMIFESTPTFSTHTNTFFSNMDKNNDSPGNRPQLHEKLQLAA